MRPFVKISFAFFAFISPAFTEDFRSFKWGDSKKLVQAKERAKFHSEYKAPAYDSLFYIDMLFGVNQIVEMRFFEDKLVLGAYFRHPTWGDRPPSSVEHHKRLKEELTRMYGRPTRDEEVWTDDTYRKDPSWAFGQGHLHYDTVWITQDSEIQLTRKRGEYMMDIRVFYRSLKHREAFEKATSAPDSAHF